MVYEIGDEDEIKIKQEKKRRKEKKKQKRREKKKKHGKRIPRRGVIFSLLCVISIITVVYIHIPISAV